MKQITIISIKHGIKYLLVDDDDFDLVNRFRWSLSKGTKTFYANYHGLLIHHLITGFKFVDHKNGNGLDNRRVNLRECTQLQNNQSTKLAKNNKTGFKGVSFDKARNKFVARLGNDYKTLCIGRFATAIEAAKAYNQAAIQHYGEFAKLNTIPEDIKVNPCNYDWVRIVRNMTNRA